MERDILEERRILILRAVSSRKTTCIMPTIVTAFLVLLGAPPTGPGYISAWADPSYSFSAAALPDAPPDTPPGKPGPEPARPNPVAGKPSPGEPLPRPR